ncbi:MAG: DUF2442 domain-containing protein [Intestinibacter sp.]|uniref:DUF2442 domain-containing protein n=1 Tax=Intestinibacter sp. TaxID=1965304 RepID=UPI003F16DE70
MYEINGMCYSDSNKQIIDILEAKPLDNYKILIIFSNGEKKIFDANYLLDIPIYSPLKDKAIWNGLVVVDGIFTWDDENLDIAPETLYLNSVKFD